MRVDRVAGRVIVVLLLVAGIAWVLASLHGSHYYRLTYAQCERFSRAPLCAQWRDVAIFRVIIVAAIAAAMLVYNERRQIA